MATDYFMRIDGIQGDSTDDKHPNEIEVVSWSWGETMPITTGGGGGGGSTGRADIQDLQFTARTSKASPLLFFNCASGTRAKTALLTARKPTEDRHEYLRVTLSDVLISSYQVAGHENDNLPMDQVSLNFARIQVSYIPQAPTGGAGTPITRGWDRATNKSF